MGRDAPPSSHSRGRRRLSRATQGARTDSGRGLPWLRPAPKWRRSGIVPSPWPLLSQAPYPSGQGGRYGAPWSAPASSATPESAAPTPSATRRALRSQRRSGRLVGLRRGIQASEPRWASPDAAPAPCNLAPPLTALPLGILRPAELAFGDAPAYLIVNHKANGAFRRMLTLVVPVVLIEGQCVILAVRPNLRLNERADKSAALVALLPPRLPARLALHEMICGLLVPLAFLPQLQNLGVALLAGAARQVLPKAVCLRAVPHVPILPRQLRRRVLHRVAGHQAPQLPDSGLR